jgi:hypothetical protein
VIGRVVEAMRILTYTVFSKVLGSHADLENINVFSAVLSIPIVYVWGRRLKQTKRTFTLI